MVQSRRRALLLGGVVSVVAATAGYVIGARATDQADWHSVTAQVVGEADYPLVSIDVDGFTYAIPDDVAYWIDARGATHSGGWPSCLRPNPAGTTTQVPRNVPIRFATAAVDADVLPTRIVVAVDCRPS
jgi:hypothetical protein